jgi:UDP-glucose 4-epimerase
MSKVLVTGGAGYIGSHTVAALVAAGHEVSVFDNLRLGHPEAVPKSVKLYHGDLLIPSDIQRAFEQSKAAGVIHFGALSQVSESCREPELYYEKNVLASFNLIRACQARGVRQFVVSSTAAVYGNPTGDLVEAHPTVPCNPYGRTKLVVEWMLSDLCSQPDSEMRAIALRYFNACGAAEDGSIGEDHTPESHLIPLVIRAALGQLKDEKGEPIVLSVYGNDYDTPDGTAVRDYIGVQDLADAHIRALSRCEEMGPEKRFDAFNVGTGEGTSVMEVINTVEKVLGKKVPYKVVGRRAGDPETLVANSKKLQRELGWKASMTLEKNIENAARFFRNHPNGYRG